MKRVRCGSFDQSIVSGAGGFETKIEPAVKTLTRLQNAAAGLRAELTEIQAHPYIGSGNAEERLKSEIAQTDRLTEAASRHLNLLEQQAALEEEGQRKAQIGAADKVLGADRVAQMAKDREYGEWKIAFKH